MADFYLAQNDTASPIFETLEDEEGVAVDIQGASVKINAMPIHGGTALINNKTALNLQVGDGSDGSRGQVAYGEGAAPYAGGETGTAGDFLYTWDVTYAGGQVQTFPNDGYRLLTITPVQPTAAQEYASTQELMKTLNLTGTTYATEDVKLALQAATTAINVHTGRVFTLGSAGEARVFRPKSADYLLINDVTAVTSVVQNAATLILNTDYTLGQVEIAKPSGLAVYDVLWAPRSSLLGTFGTSNGWADVTVTGTYGWPTVPATIKMATMILASRYLQRARSAPFAILTFGDGGEAARLTRYDPDIASLIGPYTRSGMIE